MESIVSKRTLSRKQRKKQEVKYTEQFAEEADLYFDFAPPYEN